MSRGAYLTKKRRPSPATFGERLKAVRLSFGWSQKTLASILGVAQQSVSNWEKDLVPPIGAAQVHLANVLGIDWASLETGKGFRVPVAPPGSSVAGGGLVATEEASEKQLVLPKAGNGEGWLVEVGTGESSPLDPEAISVAVKEALQEGGAVWVVVRRPNQEPGSQQG